MKRDKSYYMALPYRFDWDLRVEEGERYYLVSVAEVDGVCGDGQTQEGAMASLWDSFDSYLTWRLEDHLPIPEPAEKRAVARSVKKLVCLAQIVDKEPATQEDVHVDARAWETSTQPESESKRVACAY